MMIVIAILIAYLLFLVIVHVGLMRARRAFKFTEHGMEYPVTVIIAMRNEESSIIETLQSVLYNNVPKLEVIVVDDHSVDRSVVVVKEFLDRNPRSGVRLISNDGEGKKKAITAGVKNASYDVIVTTDADCSMFGQWLTVVDMYFSNEKVKMAFGPVTVDNYKNDFFSRLQATEFYSVYATSVATWSLHFPVMCNGANLAFRKEVFFEVGGYDDNFHIASGDDEFLMRKVLKRYPDGFVFLYSQDAIVRAHPALTANDFFHQRIRWAGKWRKNTSAAAVFLGIFVLAAQVSILVALAYMVTGAGLMIFSALLTSRVLLEGILIYKSARFFRTRIHWPSFFFLQAFYPLYVIVIGIASNFVRYRWKGRKQPAANQQSPA